MKFIKEILTNTSLVIVFASLAGLGGILGGYYAARTTLTEAVGESARAKVTFPLPDQIEVQIPSVIRGQRINCIIFADTKRRLSSISC